MLYFKNNDTKIFLYLDGYTMWATKQETFLDEVYDETKEAAEYRENPKFIFSKD